MTRAYAPKRPDRTDHTIETIRAMCTECGDCWLWGGGLSHGVPTLSHRGRAMPVRRYIIEVLGSNPLDGQMAVAECLDSRCVSPEHAKKMTRTEMQQLYHDKLRYSLNPARRLKLIAAARRRSVLTDTQVKNIIKDTRSPVLIAKEVGVSRSTIYKIKAKARSSVPIGSPWFGLAK